MSVKGNTARAMAQTASLRVGFVLADRFTLSAFSLFVDQLRLAADEGDLSRPILAQWEIMASTARPVQASCGIAIQPTASLRDPRDFDYIVVVGGLLGGERPVDDATVEYLRHAAASGVALVGLCTGSFVLARAGLMRGRRCCVSWYHHADFAEAFPGHDCVSDRLFLIDGDRITCAGGGGVADLATTLIEKHIGRSAAQKSRHVLLLERAREGSQSQPHPPLAPAVADDRVRRALIVMEQNLAEPVPIAAIAARLGLSTRQLERLFASVLGQRPAELYRSLRLRYAAFLLDTTDRPVTEIALDAGFADCAHFSRHFKAAHGVSPSDVRGLARRAIAVARERPEPPSRHQLAGGRVFD
ncbi:transcriptional regulator, AraC family with amidase-like domain [Faunimonas pinastri]|uniref:Transcriptional regulator, AraC family with amidase-like domain n=1 Tax=Faunimonas pinastri TaxID=1855383 RepID=A0A1H9HXK4_9HYPH|nr:GlxA family transcriptional regulator [Faunimonas pinastri]SEQ66935.1 transcriptional regulator, AraC family with amidase-like domain [Faunimonas pinastri]